MKQADRDDVQHVGRKLNLGLCGINSFQFQIIISIIYNQYQKILKDEVMLSDGFRNTENYLPDPYSSVYYEWIFLWLIALYAAKQFKRTCKSCG